MNAASSTMLTKKKSTGKKYCCVPGCSHTSDKIGPDGTKFILHRIPMSEKKAHIKKLWIQRLKNVRANLIVNDSTRVCSAHFDGPFTHESIPTIFPSKPMKKVTTRRPLFRKEVHSENTNTDTAELDENENIKIPNISIMKDLNIASDIDKVNTCSFGTSCTQTENTTFTTNASTCTTTDNIETDIKIHSVSVGIQTDLPQITIENVKHDNAKVRFYTGFVNFSVFWMFFSVLLKHGADKLNYWEGESRSMGEKSYQQEGNLKPGRKRFLRPIDEFFMVMMRLRLGLLQEHLADIFRVSESTVSRIMNTWINFLFDNCKSLVTWPTREQIVCNLPKLFTGHPDTRIVVDCTEFYIEKPSSLKAQWMTWSEYKHSNTFKVLIGVTPSGMVTFISRLWGGNVSDRHIVQHDEFLPKLSKGDVIMADKGFTVEDLLPADVGLNMPPRVSTKKQMSHLEFFKTNSIASARIVVEMKMEQIKNYNILNSRLPISEAHLSEQMIFICAAFTNLLPPLLK
ncbi:uncharacterized protein [Mytilus edulis]|uniref:uncharacterized protein n=1 Tax=Mytilus edulis TaxID=6550 RepID=UPI0039F0113B